MNGRPKMKNALQQRLSLLEAKLAPITNPITYRYGWLTPLPEDFVGELAELARAFPVMHNLPLSREVPHVPREPNVVR